MKPCAPYVIAWTCAILARCTCVYELICLINPDPHIHTPMQPCNHATICPSTCVPAICTYAHAHFHYPHDLPTCSHEHLQEKKEKKEKSSRNKKSCFVLLPMPCRHLSCMPSTARKFPHHANLVVPHLQHLFPLSFSHMFVSIENTFKHTMTLFLWQATRTCVHLS